MEETEQTHETPAEGLAERERMGQEEDALKDVDIESGTGKDSTEHPEQSGEAGDANRSNPKIGTDDPA